MNTDKNHHFSKPSRLAAFLFIGAHSLCQAQSLKYDFAYPRMGDDRAKPSQVYDDGRYTYIKLRKWQAPHDLDVFAISRQGETKLQKLTLDNCHGDCVAVEGSYEELRFAYEGALAGVKYAGTRPTNNGTQLFGAIQPVAHYGAPSAPRVSTPATIVSPKPVVEPPKPPEPVPVAPTVVAASTAPVVVPATTNAVDAPKPTTTVETPPTMFTVSRADKTVRETLVRWSKSFGWTHDSEHWSLDRDIPIVGAAELGADYKSAVRQLLKSTELSDKPAKPCFYSNNVLRVIALNDTCTRSQ